MSNNEKEFQNAIKNIIGMKCWAICAGEGTGSAVGLYIGDKILRKNELKNDKLNPELRKYSAELSLLISCAWRLDTSKVVLCSSTDSNENDGNMVMNLEKLTNLKVLSVNITFPSFDLKISFEQSLILNVFCNETNFEDELPNYTFYTREKNYFVDTKSELKIIDDQ